MRLEGVSRLGKNRIAEHGDTAEPTRILVAGKYRDIGPGDKVQGLVMFTWPDRYTRWVDIEDDAHLQPIK